jgi:4-diphosphocytidyl-2-C-methyl-D-erythritol kinase
MPSGGPAPAPLVEFARAKVNLALHVVGRRADGYHLLDGLAVFPPVGDRLTVRPARDFTLTVEGPGAAALAGTAADDNLVMRAAQALRRVFGIDDGADIRLEKVLPIAAGLGGGSADAAATLRALCRLWGLDARSPEVTAIALSLGADVPMCLTSRPARTEGIGDDLRPVPDLPPLGILLANPGDAVSTPAVFRALSSRENPPMPALPHAFTAEDFVAWLSACRNDLEPPAFALAPTVPRVRDAIGALPGCRLARMSGSGATCFGLFDSSAAAADAAATLSDSRPTWWVRAAPLE